MEVVLGNTTRKANAVRLSSIKESQELRREQPLFTPAGRHYQAKRKARLTKRESKVIKHIERSNSANFSVVSDDLHSSDEEPAEEETDDDENDDDTTIMRMPSRYDPTTSRRQSRQVELQSVSPEHHHHHQKKKKDEVHHEDPEQPDEPAESTADETTKQTRKPNYLWSLLCEKHKWLGCVVGFLVLLVILLLVIVAILLSMFLLQRDTAAPNNKTSSSKVSAATRFPHDDGDGAGSSSYDSNNNNPSSSAWGVNHEDEHDDNNLWPRPAAPNDDHTTSSSSSGGGDDLFSEQGGATSSPAPSIAAYILEDPSLDHGIIDYPGEQSNNENEQSSSTWWGDDNIPQTTTDCGCPFHCTEEIWNTPVGNFTCGDRVAYLLASEPLRFPVPFEACRQVAFEYPCDCGGCDPSRCGIPRESFALPTTTFATTTWTPPVLPPPPDPSTFHEQIGLHCYPNDDRERLRYTLWDRLTVEVKEGYCDPNGNYFQGRNVHVTTGRTSEEDRLALYFAGGEGSEVRIILSSSSPHHFSYGTYRFDIESLSVKASDGRVISHALPQELVLGMFTWNPHEDFSQNENWNHEVDIEISRWNCPENADAQFLVQPPGFPQMHRFFSGSPPLAATSLNEAPADSTLNNATNSTTVTIVPLDDTRYHPGGHSYGFTWKPGELHWTSSAGGGQSFSLTTTETLYKMEQDLIQCLPRAGDDPHFDFPSNRGDGIELRINLWNMLGPQQPIGLSDTDYVEVVLSRVDYQPLAARMSSLRNGDVCSRDCQCSPVSRCYAGRCVAHVV